MGCQSEPKTQQSLDLPRKLVAMVAALSGLDYINLLLCLLHPSAQRQMRCETGPLAVLDKR
jgi:hypothetical protein